MSKRISWPHLFFIFGIAFLWVRNAPLALILPLWSHGDEIAHLDYAIKIGRGHLPNPHDEIEPEVFRLHRDHHDARYFSQYRRLGFEKPSDMGLAAFSYEAPQPPLPYLVLAAFRFPLKTAGMSLFAQVKALRLVILLIVSAGLFILCRALRRRTDLGPFWSAPLLFIPLLPQDMYFSLNTDVFAFFAGCGVVWGLFRLFDRPLSTGRWAVFALLVALSMWIKATGAFFFALWPVSAVVLGRSVSGRDARRKLAALGGSFLILGIALAAPWYLANAVNHSYVFGFQFSENDTLPYKRFTPPPFEWPRIKQFQLAFSHTLIRGEFLWHGVYFEGWSQPWNRIFLDTVFWIVIAAGLAAVFLPPRGTPSGLFFVLSAGGFGLMISLLVLHFFWGGVPFYHGRYAFAGFYLIYLIYAAGWRRICPGDLPAVALPSVIFLVYNISFTVRLITAVFSPD